MLTVCLPTVTDGLTHTKTINATQVNMQMTATVITQIPSFSVEYITEIDKIQYFVAKKVGIC